MSETQQLWDLYFQNHGCIACGRTNVEHKQNGFCGDCYERIAVQLRDIKLRRTEQGRDDR